MSEAGFFPLRALLSSSPAIHGPGTDDVLRNLILRDEEVVDYQQELKISGPFSGTTDFCKTNSITHFPITLPYRDDPGKCRQRA